MYHEDIFVHAPTVVADEWTMLELTRPLMDVTHVDLLEVGIDNLPDLGGGQTYPFLYIESCEGLGQINKALPRNIATGGNLFPVLLDKPGNFRQAYSVPRKFAVFRQPDYLRMIWLRARNPATMRSIPLDSLYLILRVYYNKKQ